MTKYYSRSKGKFIDIANMPDQYVRNAFVKMCSTDAIEDVIYATQQRDRADRSMNERNFLQEENEKLEVKVKHYKKLAEDNFASSVDDLDKNEIMVVSLTKERDDYKKKANDMEMAKMNINREWLDAKDKLKDTVSKGAYQIMFDECQKIAKELDKANDKIRYLERSLDNYIPKGDLKMFSEIPNTDEGWEFVDKLKHYLNKDSYKIRVRGQYLDDETKKNEGWRRYTYGQPIEKSRCLRVYVDLNKDVD